MEPNAVTEVVLFKTKQDVDFTKMQTVAKQLDAVLANLDGFIDRELAYDGHGQWIDIVHWRDRDAALAASRAVLAIPACQPFFALIDERTVNMMHFSPCWQQTRT